MKVEGFDVDLSAEDGKAYLAAAEIMVEDVPAVPNWMGAYNSPRIKWEGEWIDLCRTDLADDVATGLCATKTAEEWRVHYLSHIHYGVRIKPTSTGGVLRHKDGTEENVPPPTHLRFACIDAWSDG